MKITCRKCAEPFDIPDGKRIDAVFCPYCETKNPVKTPETQEPTPQQKHPLSKQFWILAICAAIVTAIIVFCWIQTQIAIYQWNTATQETAKELRGMFGK